MTCYRLVHGIQKPKNGAYNALAPTVPEISALITPKSGILAVTHTFGLSLQQIPNFEPEICNSGDICDGMLGIFAPTGQHLLEVYHNLLLTEKGASGAAFSLGIEPVQKIFDARGLVSEAVAHLQTQTDPVPENVDLVLQE